MSFEGFERATFRLYDRFCYHLKTMQNRKNCMIPFTFKFKVFKVHKVEMQVVSILESFLTFEGAIYRLSIYFL